MATSIVIWHSVTDYALKTPSQVTVVTDNRLQLQTQQLKLKVKHYVAKYGIKAPWPVFWSLTNDNITHLTLSSLLQSLHFCHLGVTRN
jgi:hypothetical protein